MRNERLIGVLVCGAIAALGGCKAHRIGHAPADASRYASATPVVAHMQGGPSLFAGDRLAFLVLASGGFGPAPDGMRYAEIETIYLGFSAEGGLANANVSTY